MYTVNNDAPEKGILNYMPAGLRKYMYKINFDEAYEIHMGLGKPLYICYSDGRYFLNPAGVLTRIPKGAVKVTKSHIDEAMELASRSSMYARKHTIAEGFITIEGGHRIGICGTGVIKNGQVDFIKDISALNYRLSCECIGAAEELSKNVIQNGDVKNTLIISPPGCGKTTMLRDMARILSQSGRRVCIVDERSELAAVSGGVSQFNLGILTDVMDGVKKSDGMLMVLRSMSPDVIITDEIGKYEDITAIESIINSGVKIITSIHGLNFKQVQKRTDFEKCLNFFEMICILSKRNGVGTIEKICERENLNV